MGTDNLCELLDGAAWVPIALDRALALDRTRVMRCLECGGRVRAHRLGTTGQRAHFEHYRGHAGCSRGDSFAGMRSPHPDALG